jgi:hypothetical protein
VSEPTLSAILVTLDDWTNMRNTLQALRRQTIREQIELVLLGPSPNSLAAPDSELAGFAAIRKASEPAIRTLGEAYAIGVRAATAPLVVFTEDHCYPEASWAESFVRRHRSGRWAGVGPTVINANPASAASWGQFIIEYGPYSEAGTPGACRQIPGHNSCYRRDELLKYGPALAEWLECETLMQWDLADHGLGLYLDKEVRTHHWNCSRLWPTLSFSWYFSREFAAYRVRGLARSERAKMALLWPLIPVVRFKRLWPFVTALLGYKGAMKVAPAFMMNLFVSGAAEGLGYLTGKVGAPQACLNREFHRERFLRRGERLAVRESSVPAKEPLQRPAPAKLPA